ncbi:S53 family peptidase [Streptacidiphilus jiangxiensis]|uniref:Peptidase S53 domain-containing protein n=1 Tax=Streptacidiphilus jiangxiensis TaxID=235985 RepID=A0A1H7L411_STRJI|nr:hypothetical protein [Streptacidiphilus jiangxiensis]SEK93731.1 hypothetical protein SAMN05414137_104331 [Streptacidiphilus jiangxiensis]
MSSTRRRRTGIRSAAAVAVLAATAAVSVAPAARAQGPGGSGTVRLTAAKLAELSAKYTPRADGTPGLVAAAAEANGAGTSGSSGTRNATGTAGGTGGTAATGAAGSASTGTGVTQESGWQTARGAASTLALGGTGDWVSVFSGGGLARYDKAGKPVWTTTGEQLYGDWQVKPTVAYQDEPFTAVMYEGYDPYQPGSVGTHPYAQADFNHDGVADVAVAYSVGASPDRPFTSPGSDLSSGTFLSVLDGRTGRMLWHTLVPGTVGSLLTEGGKLIAAEQTGPDWSYNPVATQGDSRSSLLAYSFAPGKGGTLTGSTAWTYSTKAPWASWGDLTAISGDRLTTSWSDTPMGLGSPRPADGHVLVVDTATGKAEVDVRTPGYPRLMTQQPGSQNILVAEQNDPLDAVRWDLTSINSVTGKRTVVTSRNGTIPEAFVVNPTAHGDQAAIGVAELGINADLSDGQSTISGWSSSGRTLWSHQTASTVGQANAPTLSLTFDPHGSGEVYAAVSDATGMTLTNPEGIYHNQLLTFDGSNGKLLWRRDGDVVGDQVTPYRGGILTVGYDLTAHVSSGRTGAGVTEPLLGDTYSAVSVDVNGDGVKDLVVAGQSHGVLALDGRTLNDPAPRILWSTPVSAAVHQLKLAAVTDKHGRTAQRLVAATSHGIAVLETDGRLDSDVDTGAFQYGTAVTGGEIVANGTAGVSAYTADGTTKWTYQPSAAVGKNVAYSTAAVDVDGRLILEYGGVAAGFNQGITDPAPTAVSLDAATGQEIWSEQPDVDNAGWIEAQSGVFAGADIPGTDGHGVALAWGADKPGLAHLVQILDSRTGKVVTTHLSVGAQTFNGFVASARYGLIELHWYDTTTFPADGSAPYDSRVYVNDQQGAIATTTDGHEVLVGGAGGLEEYSLPLTTPAGESDMMPDSEAFSEFAGTVTPIGTGKDGATQLLGLPFDWTAYALSSSVGAFVVDSFALDSYFHGITVNEVVGSGSAASTSSATTAPAATTDATAAPVPEQTVGTGTATTSLRIRSEQLASAVKADAAGSDAAAAIRGYTPQQIQGRLGLTGDGTGQTVAIVDAYDYPTATADLNAFSAQFDLPQTCGSANATSDCFDFSQVYADGTQPAGNTSWNEEAALDIEWAHSIAPHARIVLVEAADASAQGLYQGVDKAASLHPAVVSNSWGMTEFSEESFYDGHCKLADSVCTQSTGDAGYPAGYSSTNPYALAIGGTNLKLDASGATLGESAWSSTGGGLSYFEKRPAYQDGVQSSGYRATPDVSFVADPQTGVAVYVTLSGRGYWMEVGGTSLSAPSWAAIIADADQLRAAAGKPHLAVAGPSGDTAHGDVYALGTKLNDITTGSNGGCGSECTAGPGYDTVTGLGSPLAGVDTALAGLR